VTQAQWERVMGSNPSNLPGADLPVETVSWDDCQEFLREAGGGLRLPSEAEWEYACRAGTTTPFSFGASITAEQVNHNGNHPYGNAPKGQHREQTVPCRSLPANAWGLYEMHGNVGEWCQDVKADHPGHGDERAWEEGSGARVLRGGSWGDHGRDIRAASRGGDDPDSSDVNIGFRLALSLPE
jgi:formylglycine-generating enzyme required for sulfatase activity